MVMRRITSILVALLSCLILSFYDCFQRHSDSDGWRTYRNEYLIIDYPSDYEVLGEFKYGVDNFADYRTDIPDALAANELDILPVDSAEALPWIHIVLSRMAFDSDLRFFAELSAFSRSDYEVSVSAVDSTTFSGYPALSLTFEYPWEDGDTLVQHQTIVRTDDLRLYYVNFNYFKSSEQEDLAPMMKALATLKLK